jgi:hypothetical protein
MNAKSRLEAATPATLTLYLFVAKLDQALAFAIAALRFFLADLLHLFP